MANVTISQLVGKTAVLTDELEVQATGGGASNKVTAQSLIATKISGTAGQVGFFGASNALGGSDKFKWDDTTQTLSNPAAFTALILDDNGDATLQGGTSTVVATNSGKVQLIGAFASLTVGDGTTTPTNAIIAETEAFVPDANGTRDLGTITAELGVDRRWRNLYLKDATWDAATKTLTLAGDLATIKLAGGDDENGSRVDVAKYGRFIWSYDNGDPAVQMVMEQELTGFSGEALGVRDGSDGPGGLLLLNDFTSLTNWSGAVVGNNGATFGFVGVSDGTNDIAGPALLFKTNSFDNTATSILLSNAGGGIEFTVNDVAIEMDNDGFYPTAAGKSLGVSGFRWSACYAAPVPPTSDPMIVGAWWNNSGVLTISAA